MKGPACLLAALGGAAVLVAASPAASRTSASVLIRHQTAGCHAWSVGNGPFRASQRVHLAVGAVLTVVNDDVMPQAFVETSGAKVRVVGKRALNTMGSSVKVTFAKAGTYHFATHPGEDYPGVKAPTTGEDNKLTLTVVVS